MSEPLRPRFWDHYPLSALTKAAPEADAALAKEDFAGAMRALSKLRGPVDAFFDKVTVNAEDKLLINRALNGLIVP